MKMPDDATADTPAQAERASSARDEAINSVITEVFAKATATKQRVQAKEMPKGAPVPELPKAQPAKTTGPPKFVLELEAKEEAAKKAKPPPKHLASQEQSATDTTVKKEAMPESTSTSTKKIRAEDQLEDSVKTKCLHHQKDQNHPHHQRQVQFHLQFQLHHNRRDREHLFHHHILQRIHNNNALNSTIQNHLLHLEDRSWKHPTIRTIDNHCRDNGNNFNTMKRFCDQTLNFDTTKMRTLTSILK